MICTEHFQYRLKTHSSEKSVFVSFFFMYSNFLMTYMKELQIDMDFLSVFQFHVIFIYGN